MRQFNLAHIIIVICITCLTLRAGGGNSAEGRLVVRVLIGDNNTPANDSLVYVQGYFGHSLGMIRPVKEKDGQYEVDLQPGLYDVFVGEGSSLPMCRRFEIKAGATKVFTAKLDADEEHLQN